MRGRAALILATRTGLFKKQPPAHLPSLEHQLLPKTPTSRPARLFGTVPPTSGEIGEQVRSDLSKVKTFADLRKPLETGFVRGVLVPRLQTAIEKYPSLAVWSFPAVFFLGFLTHQGYQYGSSKATKLYNQKTTHNVETGKFRPLEEAIVRQEEKDSILKICRDDNAPIKFVSISGAPGTGKSTLVKQVLDDLISRNSLYDKVRKRHFSLVWCLDASSEDTLKQSTVALAQALALDPGQHAFETIRDSGFEDLVESIQRELSKQEAWLITFDNICSMDLLSNANWYSYKSSNAGFPQQKDKFGRVVLIHRDSLPKLNTFDDDYGRIAHLNLGRGLNQQDIKKLVREIFDRKGIDGQFIDEVVEKITNPPLQDDASYPLILSTIVHYLAYQHRQNPAFTFNTFIMQLSSTSEGDDLERAYIKIRSNQTPQYPETLSKILRNILKSNVVDTSFREFAFRLAFSPLHEIPEDLLRAYAQSVRGDYNKLRRKALELGWLSQEKDSQSNTTYFFIHPAIQKQLSAIAFSTALTKESIFYGSMRLIGSAAFWAIGYTTIGATLFATSAFSIAAGIPPSLLGTQYFLERFSADFLAKKEVIEQLEAYQYSLGDGTISQAQDLEKTYQLFPVLDTLVKRLNASVDAALKAKLFYLVGVSLKELKGEKEAAFSFYETIKLLENYIQQETSEHPSKLEAARTLLVDAYVQRARCHYSQPAQANTDLDKAYQIACKLFGDNHVKTLDIELEKIKILGARGRYEQTFLGLKKLHKKFQKLGDQARVAEVLYWKAFALKTLGNFEEALSVYEECLTIRKSLFKETHDHVDLMKVNHDIGVTLRHLKRLPEAIEHLKKSATSYEKFYQCVSPHHKNLAIAYHDLGVAYLEMYQMHGNFVDFFQAKHYLEKGRNARIFYHSPRHPAVARSDESLGDLAQLSFYRPYHQAINFYQQCLNIRLKSYGKNHPETARAYLKLSQANFNDAKWRAGASSIMPDFEQSKNLLSEAKTAYKTYKTGMITHSQHDPENTNIKSMIKEIQGQLNAIADLEREIEEQTKEFSPELDYYRSISHAFS